MSHMIDQNQLAAWPSGGEFIGYVRRTTEIEATMREYDGSVRECFDACNKLPLFQPRRVSPIVGHQTREGHSEPRIRKSWIRVMFCVDRDVSILPGTPVFGRFLAHGGVGSLQQF